MELALVNSVLTQAEPGLTGHCPACNSPVIAKCGELRIWHWAHESRDDCDPWHEPESPWHRNWKAQYPKECREVVIGCHRADVQTRAGTVIELQHSSIAPEVIREREQFYGDDMVWLIDTAEFKHNLEFWIRHAYTPPGVFNFTWNRPRKSWLASERPLFFDKTDQHSRKLFGRSVSLFYIEHLEEDDSKLIGRGRDVSTEAFIQMTS